MELKKCSRCEIEKEITDFSKDKSKRSGRNARCLSCASESNKKWREKNKQHIKDYGKNHRKNNKESRNEYQKEYAKARRKTDSLYRFKSNIRSLINFYLGGVKNKRTEAILGMSCEGFKERLGDYSSNTHIDHIIPLSWAKNKEELYTLNHYSNFQLLTAEENMLKGNRFAKAENVQKVFKEHNKKPLLARIILRNNHKILNELKSLKHAKKVL